MIGVLVTFSPTEKFDPEIVKKIADEASGLFEGMPGLRQKFFTLASGGGPARNFYVWESEDAARGFFTDQLVERVTGLYGVKPTIEYLDVVGVVDNT